MNSDHELESWGESLSHLAGKLNAAMVNAHKAGFKVRAVVFTVAVHEGAATDRVPLSVLPKYPEVRVNVTRATLQGSLEAPPEVVATLAANHRSFEVWCRDMAALAKADGVSPISRNPWGWRIGGREYRYFTDVDHIRGCRITAVQALPGAGSHPRYRALRDALESQLGRSP